MVVPRDFGHYRLEALLGTGGMGEVYRAHDTRHDRDVAVKLLPEVLAGDQEYIERFRRESRVAARLREPHVIPIHDFGEIDGRLYIDMRLVDGIDIARALEDGPMPAARAVHLIGQIADALDAAHDDGLVHRDVKPTNVLLTPSDFVYVVDFGIARSIGTAGTSLTMTGAAIGTLDYMAPERFTMTAMDGRTDVYSLTCLLYECLTTQRPFKGKDLPSLMYAHLFQDPPKASEVTEGVPTALDEVIARGMAKEPADRYPTAGALGAAAREAVLAAVPATGGTDALSTIAARGPVRAAPAEDGATEVVRPSTGGSRTGSGYSGGPDLAHENGYDSANAAVAAPPATGNGYGNGGWPADPDGETTTVTPPPNRGGQPPAQPPSLPPFTPTGQPGPAPARRHRRTLLAAIGVLVVAAAALAVILIQPFGSPNGGSNGGTASPSIVALPSDEAPPSLAPSQVAASIAVPTVGDSIPVGPTPGYMEIAPNGRFAYIASRDAGVVTVLDTTINKVTATIPIPQGPPQFVSFSPTGDRAYVSVFNKDLTTNLVVFVDTATNTVLKVVPVGKKPFASATTPDGKLLYVPSHDEGVLDILDTTTGEQVGRIPVAHNPHWVTFSKDGKLIYTANHESGVVTVLDASNNAILKEIKVGVSPHSITVNPDGTRVSVVNYDSNEVSVIDTSTNEVVATVPVGKRPQDIAYAPDGRYFYTANVDANTVSVISAANNTVTASINTGNGPTSIAVMPNGKRAYVTNLNDGTVRILDIAAVQ
jgi:YVTN family beta-propeller protein